MKTLILVSCFILTISSHSLLTQSLNTIDSSHRTSYWNISFSSGIMYTAVDQVNKHIYYPGYNGSFEIFYTLDKKSAIFLNFTFNKANVHDFTSAYSSGSGFIEVKELLFGPRFYLGKGYFVEGALGNTFAEYIFEIKNEFDPYFNIGNYRSVHAGMCAAFGGGKIFELTHNTDLFIKGKVSVGIPELKAILTTGLNAGIIFKNRKIDYEKEKGFKHNLWTLSVLAGIVNPEFFHSTSYTISENFGIEAALRKSTGIEMFGSLNYNKITEKYAFPGNLSIITFTLGPRFFFGENKYFALTEIGTGIYVYNISNDSYSHPDKVHIGANFGPGFVFYVTDFVAFIAKGNMHFVFNKFGKPGGFLTASGGLRYTL